jgi:hypothetical protein
MKTARAVFLVLMLASGGGCEKREAPGPEVRAPRVSLQIAVLNGNLETVRQHIAAGSDLNRRDEYGSTPVIVAATFGRTEIAKALIAAGADLSIANNEGATPLHVAAFLCRSEIVEALLASGADKHALNKHGSTALASVAGPFEDVKGVYEGIGKGLAPLGLRLDYERIKRTRPEIAAMLR